MVLSDGILVNNKSGSKLTLFRLQSRYLDCKTAIYKRIKKPYLLSHHELRILRKCFHCV